MFGMADVFEPREPALNALYRQATNMLFLSGAFLLKARIVKCNLLFALSYEFMLVKYRNSNSSYHSPSKCSDLTTETGSFNSFLEVIYSHPEARAPIRTSCLLYRTLLDRNEVGV